MSFEFTHDDIRMGQRAMLDKLASHVDKLDGKAKNKELTKIEELDTESKLTVKEVAEAFNSLLKALKG